MMKTNKNTFIYLIIAIILAGAIVAHGVLSYISNQHKIDAETASRVKDYYTQGDLDKCLSDAETEYDRVLNLNSIENTTPGGDKAREWNSSAIADSTQAQYNKDKEFCLERYK